MFVRIKFRTSAKTASNSRPLNVRVCSEHQPHQHEVSKENKHSRQEYKTKPTLLDGTANELVEFVAQIRRNIHFHRRLRFDVLHNKPRNTINYTKENNAKARDGTDR